MSKQLSFVLVIGVWPIFRLGVALIGKVYVLGGLGVIG
jgi:hypothetical protein